MELKILVGILSGSLGTLIIREIFNQINRKIDFNRDIKKLMFTRKLDKAEKAVSFYSTYLSSLIEMKKSFELILKTINEEIDVDLSIIENLLNQHGVTLTELMKNSYSESNAVHLYFDLEDLERWNEDDISNFLENLTETKNLDNEIQFWLNYYKSSLENEESDKAEFYNNKIKEVIPKYEKSLQKVVISLEKNKLAVTEIIKNIKKQL